MSSKKDKKQRSIHLDKVWCYDCQDKEPMKITLAAFLIPARKKPYDQSDKLIGICNECLSKRSKFHQTSKQDVDRDNPDLLYKPI